MKLHHGGDWEGYLERYGKPPLDFSVNVNPFGIPEGVRQAICTASETADRYPDPLCRRLRAALSACETVPAESILCGNGAADLIYRLVLAKKPKQALIPIPSFSEYENALRAYGCTPQFHLLLPERGFRLDEAVLEALVPGLELLFLCNPNNPTGQVIESELLLCILKRCRENGIMVLLDECFQDFLPPELSGSCTGLLREFPNLAVLKAFTKIYGMAGVRLGYLMTSDCGLLERCFSAGPPWAVSSLAQAAGLAALKENDYCDRTRKFIAEERDWMKGQMEALGIRIIGSHANYLFFRSPAENLPRLLEKENLLIRSCDNYRGLPPGYCRAAIRTHEENQILVGALARLSKEVSQWQRQL